MIPGRKYFITVLLALALLLSASGSFGLEQRQSDPTKLKVLLLPFLSSAPLFIAEEKGYFTEQRLQVELIRMSNNVTSIPALAQGELDVMIGNLRVSLFNVIAREGKIKCVADKGHLAATGCSYYAVIVRRALVKAVDLENPSQLKGRRFSIGAGRASSGAYFAEKLLNGVGLTLNDVEIIEYLPHPAEQEAFEKGSIDFIIDGEPKVTRIIQGGHGVLWKPIQQLVPDFQFDVVAYGPTLLQKNPEAGRRFMVAYMKAVHRYNEGKTERNLDILAKYTGQDRELLKNACWPQFRNDGKIHVRSILDFQSWVVKQGLLDSLVTEQQFWDPSFVEYANRTLGSATK